MHILILGANSEIAFALARKFAQMDRADLSLASRDTDLLLKKARDLNIRFGVSAKAVYFDALEYKSHRAFYQNLEPKPDGAVLAFGYLGDQYKAQKDVREVRRITETNFFGAASILEIIAADFGQRRSGFIIGISSAAGERGRQCNYIYGAAKGALTIYLSGLRNRLYGKNVQVMSVIPGFVCTKMTQHLNPPNILTANPEEIAMDIYASYKKRKDVVFTKWYWKWIVAVIKLVPERIFKRLNL
jgi:short-subunit dehydrogenase